MQYAITGGAGNISKPLVLTLLKAGHQVTVIGRNENNLSELVAAGAKAAIGSVEDLAFLTKAFAGADAVYTMVPPNFAPVDWKAYIGSIGKNFAGAIAANNIQYVVNLSSVGADLPEGCGPVSGLYRAEQALNGLTGVNIKHLRPSYFYQNLYANLGLIKSMGIMGSNFRAGENEFPIVDPTDIAAAAAEELLGLSFTGISTRYIASDEVSSDQIASAIGTAVGKPDLKWVEFTDEQALGGMLQAGLPEEIAKNYVEMGAAIRSGRMMKDYHQQKPAVTGKVKLAAFAEAFGQAYQG
jgi:uncharacterized protein YbjT (DUF2867 family)